MKIKNYPFVVACAATSTFSLSTSSAFGQLPKAKQKTLHSASFAATKSNQSTVKEQYLKACRQFYKPLRITSAERLLLFAEVSSWRTYTCFTDFNGLKIPVGSVKQVNGTFQKVDGPSYFPLDPEKLLP